MQTQTSEQRMMTSYSFMHRVARGIRISSPLDSTPSLRQWTTWTTQSLE